MTIVVADTSPLNYLIQCGAVEVLEKLYQQVTIPQAVMDELSSPSSPPLVRAWLERRPGWIVVRRPANLDATIALGLGEVEAICLAIELRANGILLDDRRARRIAEERGLSVSGTLGVLEAAANHNLLLLPDVLSKLERTNFRIDRNLLDEARRRDAQRLKKARAGEDARSGG